MLSTYNKKLLSESSRSDEQEVVSAGIKLTGLEWNQYIGRKIINDFIKQVEAYDGTDFLECFGVLPFIEYGLFQSAIKLIQDINIPAIESIKQWLIKSLNEAEDRYHEEG